MKEVEVAEPIISWLENLRWEVYQEVQARYGGPIVDIVAKQGRLIWAIEVKTGLTLALIGQAMRHRGNANYISVAIPYPKRNSTWIAKRILKDYGIGCLTVRTNYIYESSRPSLTRKRTKSIEDSLNDKQKTFARAGNDKGLRWTPFQQTCADISQKVCAIPGITLKELIESTRTHYASTATARSCIAKWGQQGIIKGVEIKKEQGVLRLYPL